MQMGIAELIAEKLKTQKSRLFALTEKSKDEDIRLWGTAWKDASLYPPPYGHLLAKKDNDSDVPSIREDFGRMYFALNDFQHAVEEFEACDYEAALNSLFRVEFFLGFKTGVHSEQRLKTKQRAEGKHKEKKAQAIQLYKELDLESLSNEKAALVLEKHVALEVRTLKKYISEYKKQKRHLKELMPQFLASLDTTDPDIAEKFEKALENSLLGSQ